MTSEVRSWASDVMIRTVRRGDLPGLEWEGQYRHFRRIYQDAYERARSGRSVLWIAELPDRGIIGQVFIQLVCDRPELADGKMAHAGSFRVNQNHAEAHPPKSFPSSLRSSLRIGVKRSSSAAVIPREMVWSSRTAAYSR